MKIKEFLLEYSEIDNKVINYLKDKQYKLLGSGADQAAFLEPGTGHVLKVFGTRCVEKDEKPRLSRDQKMFLLFAKFCERNKNNPYLPRIYGYETFVFPTTYDPTVSMMLREESTPEGKNCLYLQIRMEYLKPFNPQMSRFFEDMSRSVGADDTWDDFYAHKQYQKNSPLYWKRLSDNSDSIKLVANLYRTMQNLYDIARENNFNWDLHRNNIMSRTDGTPVIVDPWTVS